MMGLIDEMDGEQRPYGIGHFDLVIIDEAPAVCIRSTVPFSATSTATWLALLLPRVTRWIATPTHLFGLETGVPTDAYSLDEAVAAGYLVPPKAHSVPIKFVREGIRYDELSDEEKEHWESLDWGDRAADDGDAPAEVLASEVNKQLFNEHTVDLMLQHLMQHGLKVDGGEDR